MIIAEVGVDMTRFPTPAHLSSWARFAPGVKESAGYYESRINPERKKRNHIRELEALGYKVTLQPAA